MKRSKPATRQELEALDFTDKEIESQGAQLTGAPPSQSIRSERPLTRGPASTYCWRCPACGSRFELGEEAWIAFHPQSPALCPNCAENVELETL